MTQQTFRNIVEYSFRETRKERWILETKDFAHAVLEKIGKDKWEISIVFCNDAVITELNRDYRGKNEPTDVLSFSQSESTRFPQEASSYFSAGDIIISIETVRRHVKELNIKKEEELRRLIIHAILHLNGMDHKKADDPMIPYQEKLLASLESGAE